MDAPPTAAADPTPVDADTARFRHRVQRMATRVHDFLLECIGCRQTLASLATDGPVRLRNMARERLQDDMPNERRRLTRTFKMLQQAAELLLLQSGKDAIATYNRMHAAYQRAEISRKRWTRYTQRGMEEELAIPTGQPPPPPTVPIAPRVPTPPFPTSAQLLGVTPPLAAPVVITPLSDDEPVAPDGASPDDVCVICFERMRAFIFIPCFHFAACGTCARRLFPADAHCPVCRADITVVHRVYK